MQTFLTNYSLDFRMTAESLDRLRLNKQALEAWQIMMTNLNLNRFGEYRVAKGWRNHPASLMWRGHEYALLEYIKAMTDEWRRRGYNTTIYRKACETIDRAEELGLLMSENYPDWMVDPVILYELTSSHRRALLVKNYDWYSKYEWPEDYGYPPDGYTYIWPVSSQKLHAI